jgi:NRPS condensation-like uncharacterized protein
MPYRENGFQEQRKDAGTMRESHVAAEYKRRVTPVERLFTRSPYSILTMVARIKGHVDEAALRHAFSKVQQRHPLLRVRIDDDGAGVPWFTSDGAGECPIGLVHHESTDYWIELVHESSQIPFDFAARPPIRFILVQTPESADLVILCHHIICDGLSLAYLARDILNHLGNPDREVEVLPDPVPIDRGNMPREVSANALVRFLINRMNKKWQQEQVVFDQQDYRDLSAAYWAHYTHRVMTVELPAEQTATLVERTRKEGVTVNSALSAAFAIAQFAVQGASVYDPRIGVAASLRDRLPVPPGEGMGFYAGIVTPAYTPDARRGFWDNARAFHARLQPLFSNKELFQTFLMWGHLDPTIIEGVNFKKLGRLVPEGASRYQKLSSFGARDDVVTAMLKRRGMESLDRLIMGTAVTNLGRLNFPKRYGALELERLIMCPGGAFPVVNLQLVLGAVTCAGRLSLLLEHVEDNIDTATMAEIRDKALELLFES